MSAQPGREARQATCSRCGEYECRHQPDIAALRDASRVDLRASIAEAVSIAHHPTLHDWNDNRCRRCWSAADAVLTALGLGEAST